MTRGLVRDITTRALDLAFPGRCVGCDREGDPLCRRCAPALDARLGEPPGVPIGLPGDIPEPLFQLEWCAPFRGTVRAALHAIKYGGEQRLAEPLGAAIARRWARAGVGGDVVVHVPVHPDRRRQRGYDQAELIARVVARDLRLPHVSALVRARSTAAQFDLDRRDRAANVAGAFAVGEGGGRRWAGDPRDPREPRGQLPRPPRSADSRAAHSALAGRWVILVDDVVTTGATLAACATTLEEAGAMGVSAITVARER